MIVFAPNRVNWSPGQKPSVFLAGSIEMGVAEHWQDIAATAMSQDFLVFNPRRPDWDASWKTGKDDPQFREQVEWELDHQEQVDYILMYFDANTKSPITLLELGLFHPTVVVCPERFWRKGNVDLVCQRYSIHMEPTLKDAIAFIYAEANMEQK